MLKGYEAFKLFFSPLSFTLEYLFFGAYLSVIYVKLESSYPSGL